MSLLYRPTVGATGSGVVVDDSNPLDLAIE
jgi:hypothetical protein